MPSSSVKIIDDSKIGSDIDIYSLDLITKEPNLLMKKDNKYSSIPIHGGPPSRVRSEQTSAKRKKMQSKQSGNSSQAASVVHGSGRLKNNHMMPISNLDMKRE